MSSSAADTERVTASAVLSLLRVDLQRDLPCRVRCTLVSVLSVYRRCGAAFQSESVGKISRGSGRHMKICERKERGTQSRAEPCSASRLGAKSGDVVSSKRAC